MMRPRGVLVCSNAGVSQRYDFQFDATSVRHELDKFPETWATFNIYIVVQPSFLACTCTMSSQ